MIELGGVSLSIIDLVIFVFTMVSAVFCCIRGFVMELSKWIGIVIGLLVAIMFTSMLSPNLASVLPEGFPAWAVSIISFASLALAGFLAVVLVGKMARKIVETFNLGVVDNILGFLWGLVFSLLVFSVIVYLLTIQPVFDLSNLLNSSVIIKKIINPLLPGTISTLENIAQEGMNAITQIS